MIAWRLQILTENRQLMNEERIQTLWLWCSILALASPLGDQFHPFTKQKLSDAPSLIFGLGQLRSLTVGCFLLIVNQHISVGRSTLCHRNKFDSEHNPAKRFVATCHISHSQKMPRLMTSCHWQPSDYRSLKSWTICPLKVEGSDSVFTIFKTTTTTSFLAWISRFN